MELNTMYWLCGSAIVLGSCYYAFKYRGKGSEDGNKEAEIKKNGDKKPVRQITTEQPKELGESFDKSISAKECFIQNIEKFTPFLPNLYKKNFNTTEWRDAIIGTNNYHLLQYWNKTKNRADAWITILQMWGIKYDPCMSFVCMEGHKELYQLENGNGVHIGIKYSVISPCWILTKTGSDGKVSKTLLLKGIVKVDKNEKA